MVTSKTDNQREIFIDYATKKGINSQLVTKRQIISDIYKLRFKKEPFMEKNKESFKEFTFFSAYKQIRNQFRRYNPLQIIDACIDYLYSQTKTEIDQLQKNPWLVLLLIKWVLIDDLYSTSGKKNITFEKFNKILQMMHDLGAIIRMPSEYSHHILFFRNIAYQQFLYQHPLNLNCLARQKILFDKVSDTHFFKQQFTNKTGLSIEHFLELGFILLCRYIDDFKPIVTFHWFDTVESHYSDAEVQNLLKIISVDINELRIRLLKSEDKKRNSREFYEQTPFLNFPLIKLDRKYICVEQKVLKSIKQI